MKKSLSFSVAALIVTVLALTLTGVIAQNPDKTEQRLRKRQAFELLINKAERKGEIRVIVGLDVNVAAEGELDRQEIAAQRGRIKDEQTRFKNRLRALRADDVEQFQSIP